MIKCLITYSGRLTAHNPAKLCGGCGPGSIAVSLICQPIGKHNGLPAIILARNSPQTVATLDS